MTYPSTEIDKLSFELDQMAERYATHAGGLASDPYFRDAIIKSSVSSFAWALFHAFDGDTRGLEVLHLEMIEQTAAIGRSIEAGDD